jgi:dGTP triphosphohydrolase
MSALDQYNRYREDVIRMEHHLSAAARRSLQRNLEDPDIIAVQLDGTSYDEAFKRQCQQIEQLSVTDSDKERVFEIINNKFRTPIQVDRDRILYSPFFQRLSEKVQTYHGPHRVITITRLVFALQTSQVARSICNALGLNGDLAEAIALARETGYPPFGYNGTKAVNLWFETALQASLLPERSKIKSRRSSSVGRHKTKLLAERGTKELQLDIGGQANDLKSQLDFLPPYVQDLLTASFEQREKLLTSFVFTSVEDRLTWFWPGKQSLVNLVFNQLRQPRLTLSRPLLFGILCSSSAFAQSEGECRCCMMVPNHRDIVSLDYHDRSFEASVVRESEDIIRIAMDLDSAQSAGTVTADKLENLQREVEFGKEGIKDVKHGDKSKLIGLFTNCLIEENVGKISKRVLTPGTKQVRPLLSKPVAYQTGMSQIKTFIREHIHEDTAVSRSNIFAVQLVRGMLEFYSDLKNYDHFLSDYKRMSNSPQWPIGAEVDWDRVREDSFYRMKWVVTFVTTLSEAEIQRLVGLV